MWAFEGGRFASDLQDDPRSFAAERGCSLAAIPVAEPATHVVAVVEGAQPHAVVDALGLGPLPSDGPLKVEEVAGGTKLSSDTGSVAIFVPKLAAALDAPVHLFVSDPARNRVWYSARRGRGETASSEFGTTDHDLDRLLAAVGLTRAALRL